MWRIYYANGVVEGETSEEWRDAPDVEIQVVVDFETLETLRWSCDGRPVRDRRLWTGEDVYDPFGWGPKQGSLISDEAYNEVWRRACGDDCA